LAKTVAEIEKMKGKKPQGFAYVRKMLNTCCYNYRQHYTIGTGSILAKQKSLLFEFQLAEYCYTTSSNPKIQLQMLIYY
jgi:hypothetical protein